MQAIGLTRPGFGRIGAPAGLSLVPGAVAYWDMTQVVGQVLPDLSGNGNHGTLGSTAGVDTNDPTTGPTGLTFDGDDLLRCGDVLGENAPYTIIVVASTDIAGSRCYASRLTGETRNKYGMAFLHASSSTPNYLKFYHMSPTGTRAEVLLAAPVTVGAAEMYTAVYDGETIRVYTGDSASAPVTAPYYPATAQQFTLGRYSYADAVGHAGTFHACRILPRALSPSEIAQEYRALKAKFAPLGVVLP